MVIQEQMKDNIRKAILRTRKAHLNTTVVLEACCFISGLAQRLHLGEDEPGFQKYIKLYMPETFDLLRQRGTLLGKGRGFCLHALWRDIRCGLVHEIDPKSPSAIIGTGNTSVHLNTTDERFLGKDLVLSSPKFIEEFLRSINKI